MTARDKKSAEDASAREAKGSVKEAIGKLIGDDEARARGAAQKQAAAADAPDTPDPGKSSRP